MSNISVKCVGISTTSDDVCEKQFVDLKGGLSECLDKLGYSNAMICYRRKTNMYMDEIHNEKAYPFYRITTGSKAEGTALYFESDIDRFFEVKDVVCLTSDQQIMCPLVVNMVTEGCAPGYTRLKIRSEKVNISLVHKYLDEHKYLVSEKDGLYISNQFTCIFPPNIQMMDINGRRITKLDN